MIWFSSAEVLVQRLVLLCVLSTAILTDIFPHSAAPSFSIMTCVALQFHYPSFQQPEDVANLSFHLQSGWYHSAGAYLSDSALWLTAFTNTSLNGATEADASNLGRVVYKDPLQFSDSRFSKSFSTSFTFQIITTRPFPDCGSGMAFFIADSLQAPTDSDNLGALGLVGTSKGNIVSGAQSFFAVEFDTRISPNLQDPSASHIGIDVDSLVSLNVTDTSPGNSLYPQLFLYDNSTFTAWIEYNDSTHLIQVWMAPANQSSATNSTLRTGGRNYTLSVNRPLHPCLQYRYDLSSVFSQRSMYIGFSATSAPSSLQGMEGHAIYSWSFSNELSTSLSPNISPSPPRFKIYMVVVPAGAAAGLALIVILVVWMGIRLKQKQSRNKHHGHGAGRIRIALETARPFSYKELKRATNKFDEKRKVGEGGYGTVYKGSLSDGSIVAIKRLRMSLMLESRFCTEASIIGKVRHRYLLQLRGWCYEEGKDALLVSEYMSKGSLDAYLFNERKKRMLGNSAMAQKETRMRILAQVAAALEYLHGGLGECVVHRDVKAANVLLTDDNKVEARLCDFGLARLIRHEELGGVAVTPAGTPGYVAPELLYDGMATDKADVYSFGVLSLEVACGRRAIWQDQHIAQWLWSTLDSIRDGELTEDQICQVLDPVLLLHVADHSSSSSDMHMRSVLLQEWRCVLHVALLCCHPRPHSRPSMKDITRAFDTKLILALPEVRPLWPFELSYPTSSASASVPTTSSSNDPTQLIPSLLLPAEGSQLQSDIP